ncbi:MAG TPA: ImcF-related family protein [Terriglobales bacterium]|jgi:type VI secretion system protein ImpL|nr:ImcF-related family protein [Terriglobales bacterium]
MGIYIITAVLLLVCLIISWLVGSILHLQGTSLWLLRGILSLLCIAGAGLFLWFHRKVKREESGAGIAAAGTEIDVLLREADRKLKASRAASATIASMPVIFILGESGSAKTSVMLHSGLEPELLAGQVYDGSDIASTSFLNVWFARKTVFIEVSAKISSDPPSWARVLQKTRPSQIKSAFGKGQFASRAVLMCFDSERFSSGGDALAVSARRFASRLREMAASLGADFPVYTLFSRMDRLPHFTEYVSNLTQAESGEVLGVTLPRRTGSQGLFVEEENNRISRTFDQLVYSLSEKRIEYLPREAAAERLPSIYEFPRELRKLRSIASQFLIELTKPTQLGANCFLRGFYFSGVRPVVVMESVATAVPAATAVAGGGATRMFRAADIQVAAQPAGRVVQSRKVPEWTFLPHLFNEVILRDRGALGVSGQSAHIQVTRRIVFGMAALVCLVVLALAAVSFTNNRVLEQSIAASAESLSRSVPGPTDTPSLDQLQELEKIRAALVDLQTYSKDGAPFSYRMGLYSGDRIYPDAHKLYFRYFQRLLLSPAQASMLANLKQPPTTRSSDDFQQMYATLKTYLITTSHHEKAEWPGFVPALLDRSNAFRRTTDPATQDLIRKQVAFYSADLIAANPFSSEIDASAVNQGRAYLKQFSGIEAIYQAMLDDAGRGKAPVNFNRQFPGSAQVVVDTYEVPAAFTKNAFQAMQKSMQNPEKFSGEEWVLGPQTSLNIPLDSLRAQLAQRYYGDYAAKWRTFLRSAHVVGYGGLKDAAAKLSRLVANDSPLLGLFWVAKENTAVEAPAIRDVFDSVQTLAKDSTAEKFVGSGNQPYMGALSQLQSVITAVSSAPKPDPALLGQGSQAASGAHSAVTQIAQSFRIDTQGRIDAQVKQLMEEPIVRTEGVLRAAGGAGAEDVCRIVNQVTAKYPFNSRASQRATLQEVQDLFRPQTGTLWTLYDAQLKSILLRQGNQFVSTGTVPVSPRFIGFMQRAAEFTDTLFPNGSPTIRLAFALRQLPSKGIDQATIVIDGQTLASTARQQFVWTGSDASSVSLTATSGAVTLPPLTGQGPWSLFEFFESADWTGSNPATLEWPLQLQFGHKNISEGARTAVRYELDTQGAQVFRKGFLDGLRCAAR